MKRGFTLVEIIVVIGIGLVILGTTTVLLLSGQRRVAKISAEEQVLSDMRSAQTKAMSGGGTQGIYFGDITYTLFNGLVYNAGNAANFIVTLDNSINLTNTFAGSNIVFLAVSGEINNYVSGLDTVSIVDATDGTSRTLRFNKYGVVTAQN